MSAMLFTTHLNRFSGKNSESTSSYLPVVNSRFDTYFAKILKKINFQLERLAKKFGFFTKIRKFLASFWYSEYRKIINSRLGSTMAVFYSKVNGLSKIH